MRLYRLTELFACVKRPVVEELHVEKMDAKKQIQEGIVLYTVKLKEAGSPSGCDF
jgi:hypothetical protein